MKQSIISILVTKVKGNWQEYMKWLILTFYLGMLFWMASVFWHVRKPFVFFPIFFALPLLVVVVFRFLQKVGR